jgi:hypothetical protein
MRDSRAGDRVRALHLRHGEQLVVDVVQDHRGERDAEAEDFAGAEHAVIHTAILAAWRRQGDLAYSRHHRRHGVHHH